MQNRLFIAGMFALALTFQPLMAQDARIRRPHGLLPKPVNLKVLPKNIAPDQLIKIMRGFTGSLGVECSFCHTMNPRTHHLDFPSDAKPEKTTARLMIKMTRAINEQYVAKANDPDAMPQQRHVTCGTCHRGHSTPEVFIPPLKGNIMPPPDGPGPS